MSDGRRFPFRLGARGAAQRALDLFYPILALGLFLALWEGYVRLSGIPNYILPGPGEIFRGIFKHQDHLLSHAPITLYEILLGYGCSLVLGGLFAVIVVWSATLDRAITPLLFFSQTVSKIAIAPLFVIWFGFGLLPKVLVSFLIAFFPIFISTAAGLKSVDTEMLDLIRSMSPTTLQVFWKARIPAALPHFFAGAKVAAPFATVGVIVGEWMASYSGLGYYLLLTQGNLDTAGLFATLLTLSFISVVLYVIVVQVERLLLPWHVAIRTSGQVASTL
jgi:NitT/TauT family transport system permease protein